MKKLIKLLLFVSSFLIIFNVKANSIDDIKMDIYVDQNGTAHVTEIWEANLDQGTEGYKPYYNLGESKITNFSVSDESNTVYTYLENWNTSGSFEAKKHKNGFNEISDGVELCWGISDYGNKTYTLKYDITNFVVNTSDKQMAYWTLIPAQLSDKPENVYIKIYAEDAFSDDLPVWGYGNYRGYAYVYDGYIEMSNENGLDSNEYMTILIEFPQSTFNTKISVKESFEDYLNKAEEGALHYEAKKNNRFNIFRLIPYVIITALFVRYISKINNYYYKDKKVHFDKNTPFFREIPCEKNIFRAYFLAKEFKLVKKETDFLGAILLKWLKEKNVEIKSEISGAILKKEQANIVFVKAPSGIELEVKLYNWMVEASEDGVLESKEFERWCKKHYQKILKWFEDVIIFERNELINEKLLIKQTTKKFIIDSNKYVLTDSLYEDAQRLAGLRNFLNEFSRINEREAIEVKLWEYYLMYAQILGVAEKVAEQFKKLYPDVITDVNYNNVIIMHSIAHTGMVSATTAKSRAESYSAGGGGFSSGGGGGGSFGGGGGGGGFR